VKRKFMWPLQTVYAHFVDSLLDCIQPDLFHTVLFMGLYRIDTSALKQSYQNATTWYQE